MITNFPSWLEALMRSYSGSSANVTLVLLKTSAKGMSAVEPTRVRSQRLKVFALAGVTLAEGFRDWETCAMPVLVILARHSPYN